MSLGAWLVTAVILVWLLWHPVGQTLLTAAIGIVVLLVLVVAITGCERQIELECNVGRVTGTFTTTQKELENPRARHVRMWRDGRFYYWPADRVTACRAVE